MPVGCWETWDAVLEEDALFKKPKALPPGAAACAATGATVVWAAAGPGAADDIIAPCDDGAAGLLNIIGGNI